MKHKLLFLATMWTALLISLSGCFGGGAEQGDPNATPTAVSEGPREDTQGSQVPDDFPVIPGAYNLDVSSNETQITFTVDGDIQIVMDYYSEELVEYGWEPTRAPDSAIGVIGSMTRQNEAGDVLSINLSYNQNGDFTSVTVAFSRE